VIFNDQIQYAPNITMTRLFLLI